MASTTNAKTPDTVKATEHSIQIKTRTPKHVEGINSQYNIWQELRTDQGEAHLTLPIINLNLRLPGHSATAHFWSQYWKTRRTRNFEDGVSTTEELYSQEECLTKRCL